jgi:hypothetical protein
MTVSSRTRGDRAVAWAGLPTQSPFIKQFEPRRGNNVRGLLMQKGVMPMRIITMAAGAFLIAVPLVSLGTPARADNNDFMGQAKRFMNNQGDDRDAYERGRSDEMRRRQAERDGHRYSRGYDQDAGSQGRYRAPDRGYSDYDR